MKIYICLLASVSLKIIRKKSDIKKKEGTNQDFMYCSSMKPQWEPSRRSSCLYIVIIRKLGIFQ